MILTKRATQHLMFLFENVLLLFWLEASCTCTLYSLYMKDPSMNII